VPLDRSRLPLLEHPDHHLQKTNRSARRYIWRCRFSAGFWNCQSLNKAVESQLFTCLWNIYHHWLSDINLNQIIGFSDSYSRTNPGFTAGKRIGVWNSRNLRTSKTDPVHVYSPAAYSLWQRRSGNMQKWVRQEALIKKKNNMWDFLFLDLTVLFHIRYCDHLLLDRSPNLGPFISSWELDKFKNWWNKSFRTSKIPTLLYQQFSKLLISQRDMSGPRLGALSINWWSEANFTNTDPPGSIKYMTMVDFSCPPILCHFWTLFSFQLRSFSFQLCSYFFWRRVKSHSWSSVVVRYFV
jgi:hypothetical protein